MQAVGPDQAAIGKAGLSPDIRGRPRQRRKAQRLQRDQHQALVLEIAQRTGRHDIKIEPAAIAMDDDGIELYRCRVDPRRRDEFDRANRRIKRRLDERISNERTARRDCGGRFS